MLKPSNTTLNGLKTPEYLSVLIPKKTQERMPYTLRNSQDLSQNISRSTQYQNSFLSSTTKVWNTLPQEIRNSMHVTEFKNHLNRGNEKIPNHYYSGNRPGQIIQSRMRMRCSPLHADLHEMHIIDDPSCECGHGYEDANHFFLSAQDTTTSDTCSRK